MSRICCGFLLGLNQHNDLLLLKRCELGAAATAAFDREQGIRSRMAAQEVGNRLVVRVGAGIERFLDQRMDAPLGSSYFSGNLTRFARKAFPGRPSTQ